MSFNRLLAILVALSVLFAPAFTRAAEAQAAVPDHHAQMTDTGHCKGSATGSEGEDDTDAQTCCISMCSAAAVEPGAPASEAAIHNPPAVFNLRNFLIGLPAEIATPPPRFA